MKFAVYLPNINEYGDPNRLLSLALLAEAVGWDGACPLGRDLALSAQLPPAEFVTLQRYIAQHRLASTPFDLIHIGQSDGLDPVADQALVASDATVG